MRSHRTIGCGNHDITINNSILYDNFRLSSFRERFYVTNIGIIGPLSLGYTAPVHVAINNELTSIFQTRKVLLFFGMFLKTSPPESSLRQLLSSCGMVLKPSGYNTLVISRSTAGNQFPENLSPPEISRRCHTSGETK